MEKGLEGEGWRKGATLRKASETVDRERKEGRGIGGRMGGKERVRGRERKARGM